jgi:cytochrome c oxidase cbb3-type subunit 3
MNERRQTGDGLRATARASLARGLDAHPIAKPLSAGHRILTVACRLSPVAVALLVTACHRENRYFAPPPHSDVPPTQVAMSGLVAGQQSLQFREQQRREYEGNAYHMSEGKRLFTWFNCTGCHANGGGGSGPALMDDRWIYGGEIDEVYLTIAQGRPNGMPAFGGKVPSQQIWQLAAYVRSMGGHGPKSARPGRDDHMQRDSEQGRTDEPINPAPAPTTR